MTQYLNFTSDFSISAYWPLRASCTLTPTGDSSPAGGSWYEIDTTAVSSWLNQDRRDGSSVLGGKRLQANTRVRPGAGNSADIVVTVYNVNTFLGEVNVRADLSDGSVSVIGNAQGLLSVESDTSDSIFIVEEAAGEYRFGFSFNTPAEATRVIFKLHTTSSFESAQYSDANLIDSGGDGLEPFEFFSVAPKLQPTRWLQPFNNPLNPDISTEVVEGADVWNVFKEQVAFSTTTQVATPDEMVAAITAAESQPSQYHLIEITTDDWSGLTTGATGDIRIETDVDFVSAGGGVFIDTASGNKLIVDKRILSTGDVRGIAWYNLKSKHFNDLYLDVNGRGGLNSAAIYTFNGTFIFDGLEAGLGDTPEHTMMYGATAVSLNSTRDSDSVVFRNCKIRGALNSVRASGAMKILRENCYFDGEFEDSFYIRMNSGSTPTDSTAAIITKNVFNGPPANENIYLVCCNTRETSWTVPGEVYPYEEGQIVQQASGFQGIVEEIYLGDGINTSPHAHNCRTIEGTEGVYGWKGDLVYIRTTSARHRCMVIDEALVSDTAAYVPRFLVTNGAPYGMDAGVMLGFLHTDGIQYGTTQDRLNSVYQLSTMGWFSVMPAPYAGAIQQFIHNYTDNVKQKHWTRVAYLNGSAFRSHPINHTDTVMENVMVTLAPVGDDRVRALGDAAASFAGGGDAPTINVSTTLNLLDRSDYDHRISNVISSTNSDPVEDGFDYPWLSNVTVANPYSPPESDTSYESVFGGVRDRAARDGCIIEKMPVVPYNGTLDQCKSVIANWLDWYRTPVAMGGWDLTVAQSGNGFAHPLTYGRDYNPGRVPIIQFQDWPHQIVEQGQLWTLPSFTATDGESDLTSSVVVTHAIDTTTLGYQWVQYDITNADGNSSTTFSVVEIIPVRQTLGEITQGTQHLLSVNISGESPINAVINNPGTSPQGVSIIGNDAGDWSRYRKRGKTYQRESDNTTLTEQF